MQISRQELEHVAKLARLNLTDEEKGKFTDEMAGIIEFVNKMNELDTINIQPTAHVIPINNIFREDIAEPSIDREKILQNAPLQKNGCVVVPKIVE